MRDVIDGWLVRHWPILVVAAGGVAWGVRLEERMGHHLTQPYHSEMRETRDSLIESKAELRYLREDVLELKKKMEP